MNERAAPIGVFDSGVGGLTVLRALRSALPAEDFIYLGDTARLPYGTKSAATVARYSVQCAAALVDRGIRFLVVACNTASASALEALRRHYAHVPCVGVIEASAAAAVAASRSQHIAVIATEGTIEGGAYQNAIRRLSPESEVVTRACSLFVAMAEEGWVDGAVAESVARRYLEPLFAHGLDATDGTRSDGDRLYSDGLYSDGLHGPLAPRAGLHGVPDTLVLGCTHFPALLAPIRAVLPAHVQIVDSAATTAATVAAQLRTSAANTRTGGVRWLATDGAARFARVSSTFLGAAVRAADVEIIDL